MNKSLLMASLSFGLLAFNTHAKVDDTIPGVVGGHPIDISEAPYQVALINQSGQQFCGGTIIAKNWVVTAAHCLWGITPGRVTVVAGQSYRQSLKNGVDVVAIHKYPGFYDTKLGKDIALLKLTRDLDLSNPRIHAIRYATTADVNAGLLDPGTLATLTGWGKMGKPGSSPEQLQSVDMHLSSLADARAIFKSQYGINQITEDQLPAWENGKSACHGDSGGPLVVPAGNQVILAGVVSWGKDCADIAPSMFARVSSFDTWIKGIVGDIDQTLPPSVNINSPTDGDVFGPGHSIYINADAAAGNSGDHISSVKIYADNQLLVQLNNAPYQYEWQSYTFGSHQIKVVATDSNGSTATQQVSVSVLDTDVPLPPTVSISNPVHNQQFNHGDAIEIAAIAEDSDGQISKVEFYQNGQLLNIDTQFPYSYVLHGAAVGDHQLTVVATDDSDVSTTSSVVNITVKAADDGCSSVSAWSANEVYPRAGAQVAYLDNIYQNKWWTQGEIPTESGQWGVWKLIGPCG